MSFAELNAFLQTTDLSLFKPNFPYHFLNLCKTSRISRVKK